LRGIRDRGHGRRRGRVEGGKAGLSGCQRGDQVDDYHGVKVADPYRWLENPDSPETRAWVEAENKVTFGYLEQLPARQAIKDRLTKLWNYERYGIPGKQGGRYFYSAQQRPAEPECALHGSTAAQRRRRSCCSTRTHSPATARSRSAA
jgi:protease II